MIIHLKPTSKPSDTEYCLRVPDKLSRCETSAQYVAVESRLFHVIILVKVQQIMLGSYEGSDGTYPHGWACYKLYLNPT
jgi:hypothetical protein